MNVLLSDINSANCVKIYGMFRVSDEVTLRRWRNALERASEREGAACDKMLKHPCHKSSYVRTLDENVDYHNVRNSWTRAQRRTIAIEAALAGFIRSFPGIEYEEEQTWRSNSLIDP